MARTVATNFTGGLQFPYATSAADIFKKEDLQVLAQAVDQHVHDGAGKGLQVSTIPTSAIADGSITSAKIADGTIQLVDLAANSVDTSKIVDGTIATLDLAAHAVTQDFMATGSSSGPSTTSTTAVDIPDLSVSITTAGGDILCFLSMVVQHSLTNTLAGVSFRVDASGGASGAYIGQPWSASAALLPVAHFGRITGVSAGTHTVAAQWNTSAGTITAYSNLRFLMVLELKR